MSNLDDYNQHFIGSKAITVVYCGRVQPLHWTFLHIYVALHLTTDTLVNNLSPLSLMHR